MINNNRLANTSLERIYPRQMDPNKAADRDSIELHQQRYEYAVKQLSGEQILDLACGKGRHSKYLYKQGFDVTGVDLSKESIDYAKQYQKPRLHFQVHDMCLPYPQQFDAVFNLFTSFGYFEKEEDNFDFAILDKVVQEMRVFDIRDIGQETEAEITAVDTVDEIGKDEIVVDIRSPEEEDDQPLVIEGVEVRHIPFYKLSTQFGDLDQSKQYLLYCDKGIMSKLQALYLLDNGYTNVKVYRK